MNKRKVTTVEAAALLDVCQQRIAAKVKQGHFPHHCRCECGRSIMIPVEDIESDRARRTKRKEHAENM
jgi:hypothetical protein